MKVCCVQGELRTGIDDKIELLSVRYQAASDTYQAIVKWNSKTTMMGDKSSPQALVEEERAYEHLDAALYALLEAAARASPTIH